MSETLRQAICSLYNHNNNNRNNNNNNPFNVHVKEMVKKYHNNKYTYKFYIFSHSLSISLPQKHKFIFKNLAYNRNN